MNCKHRQLDGDDEIGTYKIEERNYSESEERTITNESPSPSDILGSRETVGHPRNESPLPSDTSERRETVSHLRNESPLPSDTLANHVFQDSDSTDYELDLACPVPRDNLFRDQTDSWDWTFPDENVSDLDIITVPTPKKAAPSVLAIDGDSARDAGDKPGPDSSREQDENAILTKRSRDSGEQVEEDRKAGNCTRVVLGDVPETVKTEPKSGQELTQIGGRRRGKNYRVAYKDKTIVSNTNQEYVYFGDSLSSKLAKTRLKYLQINSKVVSRTRMNMQGLATDGPGKRGDHIPVAKSEAEQRTRGKASKLEDVEGKFMSSVGQDGRDLRGKVEPHLDKGVVYSSISPPTSTHQPFLPPIIAHERQDLLSARRQSHAELLVENTKSSGMMRDRILSKPDVEVKGCIEGQVCTPVTHHQKMTGLERFRHVSRLILILLKVVGWRRKKQKETNYNFLSWTIVYDGVLGISRLEYDSGGLSFDAHLYKANKESTLSQEVKEILRLPPRDRSEGQVHSVMVSLQNLVPTFSEFPRSIQQSMIQVCTYDRFEAGRIIIRQGHRADNFYIIISGSAVVTKMDSSAGHVTTISVLKKGNSFGELAFLHMSKRSATVTCRDDVELISIERDDFIDIFMRPDKGREPAQITFLRSLDLLTGWPVELLPHANPKICTFTYVRRGVVLCRDSIISDWIIVVYSGSCMVLKKLRHHHHPHPAKKVNKQDLPTHSASDISEVKHLAELDEIFYKKHVLLSNDQDKEETTSSITHRKMSHETTSPMRISSTIFTKRQSNRAHAPPVPLISGYLPPLTAPSVPLTSRCLPLLTAPSSSEQMSEKQTIFIEIARLEAGDIFGLEHIVLCGLRDVASYSLVSVGAEVVLINKTFFKKHLTEDATKRMRQVIRPLPSEKSLKKKYEGQRSWEMYKSTTLTRCLDESRAFSKKFP